MKFNYIYYFEARFGYDVDGYEIKTESGFVPGNGFQDALAQIESYYGTDLISTKIEYLGDTGILCVDSNKEVVKELKKAYIHYHYGEEEEATIEI